MTPVLIGLLVFVAVVAVGASVIGLVISSQKNVAQRLAGGGVEVQGQKAQKGKGGYLLSATSKIGDKLVHKEKSGGLAAELAQAGYYGRAAPAIYFGGKILLMLTAAVVSALLLVPTGMDMASKTLTILAAAGVMFFLPNYFVDWKRKARSENVRRRLPDVVDLMEVCVSSGMGFETAWKLISDEIREVNDVIADEMTLTNLEVHLGASRKEAMEHMARRTGAKEISSFATLVAQSDRFGTSMSDALRVFASSMRDERSQKAEEKGEKAAVKLLIPMVLFVFPAVAVVLAGPGVIRIAQALGQA